jgi:hypothetical protein
MRHVDGYSLWLGHIGNARDLNQVCEAGIEAVVDLALNEPPVVLTREMAYCRFPLIDGGGNPPWMLCAAVETVARLIRSEVRTLVYCGACMSRTPVVAAAAVAAVSGKSLAESLALVVNSGAADISPVFWKELLEAIANPDD